MNTGDKFRAIRKSNGKPVLRGILSPDGLVFTCDQEIDGVITCEQETFSGQPYQIFTKYFDTEAI